MIDFTTLIKMIGWLFVIVPLAIFLLFSIIMVKKISEDDASVKLILTIGFSIFLIGGVMLLFLYLTNVFIT